jgi:hypothetical protein
MSAICYDLMSLRLCTTDTLRSAVFTLHGASVTRVCMWLIVLYKAHLTGGHTWRHVAPLKQLVI